LSIRIISHLPEFIPRGGQPPPVSYGYAIKTFSKIPSLFLSEKVGYAEIVCRLLVTYSIISSPRFHRGTPEF